jgi:hypothetical protein
MLEDVKRALGITGAYLDDTLQPYIDDVMDYLAGAGVPESRITPGLVARGVSDVWNYGSEGGALSPYFLQRAAQLALK